MPASQIPQLKLLDQVNKMLCEREMVKHFMKEGDCLSVASLKSKFRGKIRRKKKKSEKKKLMYTENAGNEESDSFSVDTMYQASVDMPFEEKLKNCRDFIFTEEEERYINGRAEEYANSVQPHIYYYIRPMSSSESYLQGHPLYKAYLNGHRVQKAPTKPNKRRIDKCDYHFLTPGNPLRHPSLPIGTQVIRPKDPLTCLVYDTVKNSPDGLLQACHVYTALQNKYPYFTCLDNSAFDSWKKSIRGIMCDKNFLGLKFKTTGIKKKGCFWSLKPDYDPRSERHCVKKTATKTSRKKDKSLEVTVGSAVDEMISNSEMTRETQTSDISEPPKPKLSKAEKEKLKAEEEARKAEEEAEARIKAEQEAKEQKQKEQEEEANRKKQENEEKKLRYKEMTDLNGLLYSNRDALQELHTERRKKAKWDRYMLCDGSPDPTNLGEINTYINLRLEDTAHDDVESVFKTSELDTALIQELEFLLEDTPPEEMPLEKKRQYEQTKEELQALIKKKMDAATFHLLEEATDRANPETFNLQFSSKSPDVCLSVWGNLSKNPRIKSFEFVEQGLTFEIPRVLCLSDCAIRVLDPKYDHYSPTCKSFYPRQKKKPEPVVEASEEQKEGEEKKEEEGQGDNAENEEAPEREPTDLLAALKELEEGPKDEDEEGEEKKEEVKEEEVVEYVDPPTPEPLEWEDFDEDEDVVDLRAHDILGGVFHFDLMTLPPQPNTLNKWVVTRLVDPPEIQYMDYVADYLSQIPKENTSPTQDQKRDEKPPIGITMKLPSDSLFSEEPVIARWDYKKRNWRQDGFSDLTYDEDNRIFSFKTGYFGMFALLQDSHLNMPFQSWELRPHKTNAAVLTIIAAIVEVEIEIKDALCCLSKPEDRPELDKIRNKWVTPKELTKLMKLAGINLFPAPDSSKYVSIQNKNALVTECAYEQMALLSSAIAFSWSKWNGEMETSDKVLFQGSEALEDEALLEDDWKVFLMTKKRAMKLQVTEFDETFSEDLAENTTFKSNLYNLMMSQCSEEAKERINGTSFQYVDCVEQILKATKVLSYS